jgi:hypothetical protein
MPPPRIAESFDAIEMIRTDIACLARAAANAVVRPLGAVIAAMKPDRPRLSDWVGGTVEASVVQASNAFARQLREPGVSSILEG